MPDGSSDSSSMAIEGRVHSYFLGQDKMEKKLSYTKFQNPVS